MDLKRLGVLSVAGILLVTACNGGSSSPSGGGGIAVKIGIELPMTGGEAPNGVPTANGVALALQKIQVPGFTVTIEQEDDAVNGKHNADQGAKNMHHPGQRPGRDRHRGARTTPTSPRRRSRSATRPASCSAARPTRTWR